MSNPSPTKRRKVASNNTKQPPGPPPITATYHRRQTTATTPFEVSADRQELIAAILPSLDKLNQDIAAHLATPGRTKAAQQKCIDACRRQKQLVVGAMAFVHIMDGKVFQRALADLRAKPRGYAKGFVAEFGTLGCTIMNYWSEKAPLPEDHPAGNRTNNATAAQNKVGTWYGRRCIITNVTHGDACHIIPDCVERLRNPRAFDNFWDSLRCFWNYDECNVLQDFVSDPANTTRNLTVMGKETHDKWSKHVFLLSPRDWDSGSLRLEFKWVRPAATINQGVVYDRPSDHNPICYHDPNRDTFQRIESGDTVELRTIAPDTIHLPHPGLLGIQEALVVACNAAAAADVMTLLFDRSNYDPDGGAVGTQTTALTPPIPEPHVYEPAAEVFPHLSEYQIKAAVHSKLIREDEVEEWRRCLVTGLVETDAQFGSTATAHIFDD